MCVGVWGGCGMGLCGWVCVSLQEVQCGSKYIYIRSHCACWGTMHCRGTPRMWNSSICIKGSGVRYNIAYHYFEPRKITYV